MKQQRNKGFTLIELLTVIAIISILTAMGTVGLSRALEKSKITKMKGTFRALNTALATYATSATNTVTSYPPAYGFISYSAREMTTIPENQNLYYHLSPYTAYIGHHNDFAVYDVFGESYDVNTNGSIDWYEFSPIGVKGITSNVPSFPNTIYTGPGSLPQEESLQLNAEYHPVVYAPVNLAQFKRAQRYWLDKVKDFHARTWDGSDPDLASIQFPPPKYDAFVLISAGPVEGYYGVVPEYNGGVTNINPAHRYHIQALRTYFLATRDMDQNGHLDYDFIERTQAKEGGNSGNYNGVAWDNRLPAYNANGQLDPSRMNAQGPLIQQFTN